MRGLPNTHALEAKVARLLESLTFRALSNPEGCFIMQEDFDLTYMCLPKNNQNLPLHALAQVYFDEVDSMLLLMEEKQAGLGFTFGARAVTDTCAKQFVALLLQRAEN